MPDSRRGSAQMRIKKRLLAAVLAALCLLAGCGEQTQTQGETPKVDNVKVSSDYFGLAYYETGQYSPVTDDSSINQMVYEAMYEGLFEVSSSFTATPVLCEAYEMQGRTFIFQLKSGVTFWNGEALMADDVVFSLRQAWEQESSPYYARMRQVESITAQGNSQVTVTLYSANVNFPRLLNIPIYREQATQSGFYLGTGPYSPQREDSEIHLVANSMWHKGYLGSIRDITLVMVNDVDAALSSFQTGDVSVMRAMRVASDPMVISGSVETVQTASANLHYLGINHERSVMQDKNVRQAIRYAINRQSICDVQLQTFADPAVLPINPQPSSDTVSYSLEADTERAIALMKEAGQSSTDTNDDEYDDYDDNNYDDDESDVAATQTSVSIYFIVNSGNSYKVAAAEQIAATLQTVGFRVELEKLSDEAFQYALENGNFDMYYGEVHMTPDFDLRSMLLSDGVLNYGGYNSEEMQTALSLARAGEDTRAFYELFLEEMPIVPIAFLRQQIVIRRGLVTVFEPAPYNLFASVETWESE